MRKVNWKNLKDKFFKQISTSQVFGLQHGSQDLTIVTGSDASHAKSLLNLLKSIKKYEANCKPFVYDLGLTEEQRDRILSTFDCTLRTFEFDKYPSHVNIKVNAGQYAWKPIIIEEVARESTGVICWMDAGNILTGSLNRLYRETHRRGYSPYSSGRLPEWTHTGMLDYLTL